MGRGVGVLCFLPQLVEWNHGNTACLLDPKSVSPDFVEWKAFLFFLTGGKKGKLSGKFSVSSHEDNPTTTHPLCP